jgi:hypothetical protein
VNSGVTELTQSGRQGILVLWQHERRGKDQIRYAMRDRRERTLGGPGKDQFRPEPAND